MIEKKRVALIYGGRGQEHPISVSGAENLMPLIDGVRYETLPLLISESGDFYIHSPYSTDTPTKCADPVRRGGRGGVITDDGSFIAVDCAFPLLHGDHGEDGEVQGLLSALRIPFVGSDTRASAICLDKAVTKSVAEALGIPTVPWRLLAEGDSTHGIDLPAFVKPDTLGSSCGASEAHSEAELECAVRAARTAGDGRVLAERLVRPIRELECAYFSAQGENLVTPAGEILCDGFYSYGKKYSDDSVSVLARAELTERISNELHSHAERLCRFIGIRHLARIDFFLSGDRLYFNEINTLPGMTATSLYLRLLDASGIPPEEAVARLISDAIAEGAQ